MRLVALIATALMVAGSASANVFDPAGSFASLRIAGLYGRPHQGNAQATGKAVLTGGAGAEVIVMAGKGMGQPNLFETQGFSEGAEFLTGTPNITNIFLTLQNGTGTFTQGSNGGNFQGAASECGTCFGGTAPLKGQTITEILGAINAITPINVVGASGPIAPLTPGNPRYTSSPVGALSATIFAEGAQWMTGTATITNIATNIISITTGPRVGQTGVGITLQVTPFEDSVPTPSGENGVVTIVAAGTTSFTPATGGASPGVNQVTLISPVHIDASTLTSNPPTPGLGVMTLRYVPEPGTMLLLGSAVAGLLVVGRKRMKR